MGKIVATALMLALSATAAAGAQQIRPGQWSVESRITDVNAPGLPPQMLDMMRRTHSMNVCVTPEQAASGPKEMLQQNQQGRERCKFTAYDMKASSFHGVMECAVTGDRVTRITMDGTFTATSYQTKTVMDGGAMRMAGIASGQYLGPCSPGK